MKKAVITVIIAFIVIAVTQTTYSEESLKTKKTNNLSVTKSLASMSLTFTENQGQWDEKIKFRANAGRATMWFSPDGVSYQFSRKIESENFASISDVGIRQGMPDKMKANQKDSYESLTIKANFMGANQSPQMVGVDMIDYKCNYFIGNDQSKWATDVPNYTAVMYEEIYDGIDLKYYGNGTHMEYDFIVSPDVDYSQIKIQYEGAESIAVNENGELVVTTIWGEVVEQRPIIYQVENNRRIPIDGKYLLQSDNSFSFEVENYNTEIPLVIDPVLVYSTYLGSGQDDYISDIALDSDGFAYVTGHILGSVSSSFITKFSIDGSSLIYSTLIGGTGYDESKAIVVDGAGAAYIVGNTSSTDFPIINAYDATLSGSSDYFVLKLNSAGNSLIYSTYLGGSSDENNTYSADIAVDFDGEAYVAGGTWSTDFPTTANTFQNFSAGDKDGFVTKFSSAGNSLVYSTYLGGTDWDDCSSIAVSYDGLVYVTGLTSSTNFPTFNPIQGIYQGGPHDAFVTKLTIDGKSLVYSTYLGGNERERGQCIALNSEGEAYVAGNTRSTDFPTLNPFQGTLLGSEDGFITKLNSSGTSLIYSTYFGGAISTPGTDVILGIAVGLDASRSAYVTGYTGSTDFPIFNPVQGTHQGGVSDAFVAKLTPNGTNLQYSTYLGGSESDFGNGIAVDVSGDAYVTGSTSSTNFPTTQNPHQSAFQGGTDGFVTKLYQFSCIGFRGNVDGDPNDEIDIADLVFLVDYMFLQGVEPPSLIEANIDGDQSEAIDIADLVYLVDYMFANGSPPAICP